MLQTILLGLAFAYGCAAADQHNNTHTESAHVFSRDGYPDRLIGVGTDGTVWYKPFLANFQDWVPLQSSARVIDMVQWPDKSFVAVAGDNTLWLCPSVSFWEAESVHPTKKSNPPPPPPPHPKNSQDGWDSTAKHTMNNLIAASKTWSTGSSKYVPDSRVYATPQAPLQIGQSPPTSSRLLSATQGLNGPTANCLSCDECNKHVLPALLTIVGSFRYCDAFSLHLKHTIKLASVVVALFALLSQELDPMDLKPHIKIFQI
ncbi:hypothetical protein BCR33DRAFT_735816 [Rhizoclosmatium globosum]|uniref:Uncharacterized protein n=1 Tax=Rhizoclosmatium globosum TaxID=329046 RepID=A0A1Y2CKV5_9FUNG|nr:hypothetical protein BCR33DRAFT_735816 [Rhizoclosmatium globosum]|eukprot:ORY47616.1 hypothetical protein BCR33DRAFT_735816 [Rhizoclosmatium globosum]